MDVGVGTSNLSQMLVTLLKRCKGDGHCRALLYVHSKHVKRIDLGRSGDLLWPTECGRRDSPGLEKPSALFTLLELWPPHDKPRPARVSPPQLPQQLTAASPAETLKRGLDQQNCPADPETPEQK